MRTREVNPDRFERAAKINYADGLQGRLLIITGSGETITHIQIIEGLVDRLIELGKPFDYMVYPNRDHGLARTRDRGARQNADHQISPGKSAARTALEKTKLQRNQNHCFTTPRPSNLNAFHKYATRQN